MRGPSGPEILVQYNAIFSWKVHLWWLVKSIFLTLQCITMYLCMVSISCWCTCRSIVSILGNIGMLTRDQGEGGAWSWSVSSFQSELSLPSSSRCQGSWSLSLNDQAFNINYTLISDHLLQISLQCSKQPSHNLYSIAWINVYFMSHSCHKMIYEQDTGSSNNPRWCHQTVQYLDRWFRN